MFDDKTILITGGTGSFGRNFVKYILRNGNPKKIIVFSRDELKQHHMAREFTHDCMRFFLGDVRDLPRLERALQGVDIVVHAAALKQVPALEYNPMEAVKTNVIGSQNVIDAAIDQKVERVLLISTDKAAHPVNLYGSTKLCAEKLFVAGNSYSAARTKCSVVRYGNVIGSRGSIVEVLLHTQSNERVKITELEMTRFWINYEQACNLVSFALENMEGGEIFIPKIPSMKLVDLVETIAPHLEREVIGLRPGEKMHEVLLTAEESRHTIELDNYYVILPEFSPWGTGLFAKYHEQGQPINKPFSYSSDTNPTQLTQEELRQIVAGQN